MRSFRSRPVGWRQDSHRHYLAAKGIKTRYLAEKPDAAKRVSDMLKFLADDGRPEIEDTVVIRKQAEIDTMRNDLIGKLQDDVENGRMTYDASNRFLEKGGPFEDEAKDFKQGVIDYPTFKDNVDRRLERHRQVHKRTLNVFGDES